MSPKTSESPEQKSLRLQALSHLTGDSDPTGTRTNAAGALAVLYELASSPLTAEASLKLLHELQVHQVELDLQEEELRRAVADLETALFRQVQLHESAPAGLFSVDRSTALRELNRMGAQLLGFERDALIGRTLDSFLEPDSSRALHLVLRHVAETGTADGCALHFAAHGGAPKAANASVGPDPAGEGFLIACVEIRESGGSVSA